MIELKSTLRVINEADLKSQPGAHANQTGKFLVGGDECPSERIHMKLMSFVSGAHAPLHWHPTEASYYVISGRAVITDIEGKTCEVGPGTCIYYPPGITGSHQWDVKEPMQLITVRATTDPSKLLQFRVDKATMESSIELDRLVKHKAVQFKSIY
jgi:mannose-6-phosphate isomerase-like protein (cupin superfamily)